jgi:hypothetical protein
MATGGSMELIKWLTNKDLDNAPSLVVVIIVVCVVIFETTVLAKMFLPIWLQKKGDSEPVKKPVAKNNLIKIMERLGEIDKRLDAHYGFIKESALQSGVALLCSQDAPFVSLVKGALLNIKLGANGNVREKLVQAIIKEPNGRELYQSILSDYMMQYGKTVGEHFIKTIDWIEKRLDAGY